MSKYRGLKHTENWSSRKNYRSQGMVDRQEKNVFKVDRLVAGGSREGVNKRWDTGNSNRLKLGIGGLETRDNLAEYVIKNSEPIPDYLQKDKLSHIFSSPFGRNYF